MNLCRCERGHFYDKEKYESCPHCNNVTVIPRVEQPFFYKWISNKNNYLYIQSIKQELLEIRHENIVSVYDIQPNYIKEQYINGDTIEKIIEKREITLEIFLNTGISMCEALEYLYRKNMIYMDMKPSNIKYDKINNKSILIDIESILCKNIAHNIDYFGTIEYSAPEQIMYSNYSIEGCVYSLGLVFYKMVVGVLPFEISQKGIIEKINDEFSFDFDNVIEFKYKEIIFNLIKNMVRLEKKKRIKIGKVKRILCKLKDKISMLEKQKIISRKNNIGFDIPCDSDLSLSTPTLSPSYDDNNIASFNFDSEFDGDQTVLLFDGNNFMDDMVSDSTVSEDMPQTEFQQHMKYREELLREYNNILKQAKVSFWCWVSTLGMCYIIIGICIYLILNGRFMDTACTFLLEGGVYAVQKIFSIREDYYRELINKKISHLEKGDFFEFAASKVDVIKDVDKKDRKMMQIVDDIRKICDK